MTISDGKHSGAGGGALFERPVGAGPDIGAFEFGAPDRILTDGLEEN